MKKAMVTLPNKETIYYLEKGDKKKETLLLLHGNMSSGVHFLPILNQLAKTFHVIAPDMRGFGDSSYHTPITSLSDFADDMKAFCDSLNLKQIYLAGWSTGGGVALKFSANNQDVVKKLILIESASHRGYPILEKDEQYQVIPGKLYQSKEAMAKDPIQVAPADAALKNQDAEFMKKIWEAAIYNVNIPKQEALEVFLSETLKQRNLIDVDWALMTFNMSDSSNGVVSGDQSIANVKCPVLAVYGLKDLIIPKPMFDETVEALNDVQVHIFDSGSHSPITDFPNALVRVIEIFLNG